MKRKEKKTSAAVAALPAPPPPGYWASVSAKYTFASRFLIVALVLFICLFALLSGNTFSYQGFFYFGRDLTALASLAEDQNQPIYYTYGKDAAIALPFHGGVANVHSTGVEIYDAAGKNLLSVKAGFKAPAAVSSRSYLLAYDRGGTDFSISNSYAELYRGTAEFPIYGAHASDAGYFMLITASDHNLSQVLLYDANFSLIQRFNRASATIAAKISPSGRYTVLLGTTAQGGVLDIYRVGDTEPVLTRTFVGEMPLDVDFTSGLVLTLVTDQAVRAIHVDGRLYNTHDTKVFAPAKAVFVDGCSAVLFKTESGVKDEVVIFDKKGKALTHITMHAPIRTITLGEDLLWAVGYEKVMVYDLNGSMVSLFDISADAIGLATYDRASAYVFYPAKAERLTVEF